MNARTLAALALLTLFAPSAALALCPNWRVGPLLNQDGANGANGPIGEATVWDPDDVGPLQTRLVIAGSFSQVQGFSTGGLAEHDPATGTWHSLGSGVSGQVMCFTVYNGELIVAGTLHRRRVARQPDRALEWQLVGPLINQDGANGANGPIGEATVWDPDDVGPLQTRLVIAGSFSQVQGFSTGGLAEHDPATGTWHPLGSGVSGQVMCFTVYNGELIVAGTLATAGGSPVNRIARWNGSSWQALGSGILGTYVRALTVYNGELIAAGLFSDAGGVPVNNIARWNGSSWAALGAGVTGNISAVGLWGTDLVVGGRHQQRRGAPP